ncbi:hypothetical protein H6F78_12465 [Coleofasciculus sp. FACHB-64]|jgi:hypothetical protein|uniref:hypothetical protein n=1 Tax=Cyanophyceae TaxID=3028117 RepID=UPI00168517AB|nr:MULTISPECIES: hypothetical protein [unclassified Coleofasciculus]MBD1840116.1 hypothetical protein [Coleofasciculus sp. FACHB-501]MBD1881985.1 hypothetical protein [Coleofasciculus sp. FACHB-T130]MBD1887787.1 hypothetical protein [Coleofasciculus sp. FACHB-SPT9]MBD1894343.1 hypothetical protein [Coleofasciculus sp. FACHB-129]MBD1901623.1 hypothetical protein [Coleofasciculus sp. FACHB-125]
MIRFPASSTSQFSGNTKIWESLKQAIASSSGFQRWEIEHPLDNDRLQEFNLDYRVRRYLRETLETLAY